ncbi:MAG: copper amine oxidase N-terminal domain-containing protein [Clostridia bacterium]|nr:copper amine oxidase N-terminal domain-containing protein [Clostridia bacterium]
MRKTAFLLVICVLVCNMVPAFAAENKVVVGEQLAFQEGSGPVIINERLMLPLRAVSEALDATIYWFGEDKRIQIVRYDTLLSLQIGNSIMAKYEIKNGKAEPKENIEMDVPPTIQNDRTYVPVRAISEAFSATIQWDNPNRTATIIPVIPKENKLLLSEVSYQSDGTLCAITGVICKDASTGAFYLRSLQKNLSGSFDRVNFCTPSKTSISTDTSYSEYITAYWQEQFGTDNPSGTVVCFTGINTLVEGVQHLLINKTTTGIRSLGHYDAYMRGLSMTYQTFGSEDAPAPTPESTPDNAIDEW